MEELLQFVTQFNFRNEWWVLFTPLIFMAVDILTGVVRAWVSKDFKSSVMRVGLGKKAGEIAVLIVGELLSYALGLPDIVMNLTSFYIIFMEFVSVCENVDHLGIPIPSFIKNAINDVDNELYHKEE